MAAYPVRWALTRRTPRQQDGGFPSQTDVVATYHTPHIRYRPRFFYIIQILEVPTCPLPNLHEPYQCGTKTYILPFKNLQTLLQLACTWADLSLVFRRHNYDDAAVSNSIRPGTIAHRRFQQQPVPVVRVGRRSQGRCSSRIIVDITSISTS